MNSVDIDTLDWEKTGGLIPAIVQDARTGSVLMLGYMNREALNRTREIGRVTFWSRTRKALWTKGETSGNVLVLREMRADCDRDTLLVLADPHGPTCHQGTRSCFGSDEEFSALEFLGHLERVVGERKRVRPEKSYTSRLLKQGLSRIGKKVEEEATEVALAVEQEESRIVEESADLLYHLVVLLAAGGATLAQVMNELRARHRR